MSHLALSGFALQTRESNEDVVRVLAAYHAVSEWDFSTIASYCVSKGIYSQEEMPEVVDEYARFIALATTFGEKEWVPISGKLDDMWHTHIIFTEDYASMCLSVVGRFIHHRPRILDDKYKLDGMFAQRTLGLYRQYFGEPNSRYWNGSMCTCQVAD